MNVVGFAHRESSLGRIKQMIATAETDQIDVQQEEKTSSKYSLTRNFVLRTTGFPIETIQALASPELCTALESLSALKKEAGCVAETLLTSEENLSRSDRRRLKRGHAVPKGDGESGLDTPLSPGAASLLEVYRLLHTLIEETEKSAGELYGRELQRILKLLYEFATSEKFQQVLLLSSPKLAALTPRDADPPLVRNSQLRKRELTWVSYLQRLTTKNETISFFGPSVWGEMDAKETAAATIELSEQLVAEKLVYVERWVCEALAQLISADSEAGPLLPLRLADDVVIEENQAFFLSTGKTVPLSDEEKDLLRDLDHKKHCDSQNPGVSRMIQNGILWRGLRVPVALRPFVALKEEILSWPEHPAKARWSECLQRIDEGRALLEHSSDLEGRRAALQAITGALEQVGLEGQHESQALYASRLPINEDCRLGVRKSILGKPVIEQLQDDLAPWYEFWRDLAGLYATRLHESLQKIWQGLGATPVPLPVFFRACRDRAFPFSATGGTGLSLSLDHEIQQAWRQQLGERWTRSVVNLTNDDLSFLRRNFRFRRMKSFDNMAPDIQIIAKDSQALASGEWSLLVAEIHPDFTTWEHCFFAWCPDGNEYALNFSSEGGHDPAIVFGPYPPFFTSAHVSLGIFPYTHDWTFVGVQGPKGARELRSAETTVVVTPDDVQLLHQGRVLGSMLHTWNTALNTHRLELCGGRDHNPRLQIGRAIVQRESWTIQPEDELRQAADAGGFRAFSAFRKFREQHQLPETVFARGCLPYRLNLHKDIKPIFVDFRNPLLVDVLSKMTERFRRLSISEMLPRLEDCWLEGPGGHYSCEFRTVVKANARLHNGSECMFGG
jgi:hypothetical protein